MCQKYKFAMYKIREYLGLVIMLNIFLNLDSPAKGFAINPLIGFGVPQIKTGIALADSNRGAITTMRVKC